MFFQLPDHLNLFWWFFVQQNKKGIKMKKQFITIGLITMLTASYNAHCASIYCSEAIGDTTDCPYCKIVTNIINCGDIKYCNCTVCKDNTKPTTRTIQTGQNQYTEISECQKTIGGGELIGGTCPNECPNNTWTNVSGTNYQTRCDSTLLYPQCEYQCQSGYYGNSTSCTR